jgi:hypothetical protein
MIARIQCNRCNKLTDAYDYGGSCRERRCGIKLRSNCTLIEEVEITYGMNLSFQNYLDNSK